MLLGFSQKSHVGSPAPPPSEIFVLFEFFVLENSTDSFCLTALTLAGQVPPVPVCTLLWLVPQTVSCQSHIRLTSYWRQAGLQAVQALDQ